MYIDRRARSFAREQVHRPAVTARGKLLIFIYLRSRVPYSTKAARKASPRANKAAWHDPLSSCIRPRRRRPSLAQMYRSRYHHRAVKPTREAETEVRNDDAERNTRSIKDSVCLSACGSAHASLLFRVVEKVRWERIFFGQDQRLKLISFGAPPSDGHKSGHKSEMTRSRCIPSKFVPRDRIDISATRISKVPCLLIDSVTFRSVIGTL